jgi:hypothetical protein
VQVSSITTLPDESVECNELEIFYYLFQKASHAHLNSDTHRVAVAVFVRQESFSHVNPSTKTLG